MQCLQYTMIPEPYGLVTSATYSSGLPSKNSSKAPKVMSREIGGSQSANPDASGRYQLEDGDIVLIV